MVIYRTSHRVRKVAGPMDRTVDPIFPPSDTARVLFVEWAVATVAITWIDEDN